jgi:glycosyltransferase involved in cell wall biosynthesis
MISVCILTKNCADTIYDTLAALTPFPEVLILDNGSTDATLEICRRFANVQVHTSPFIGFGPLRNAAAKLAKHDWILALDSDEVPSPALLNELTVLPLDPQVAYAVRRHNFYNGKWIRGCGWDPEWVARLYHRGKHRYCNSAVHESLVAEKVVRLKGPLYHTPYRSTDQFLQKMQHYSTLYAEQNRGKRSSFSKALTHGFFAFFRSYFLKRGWLCGREGFIISVYNGNSTFYKYLKLAEKSVTDL